jgi:hypothetical protein
MLYPLTSSTFVLTWPAPVNKLRSKPHLLVHLLQAENALLLKH